MRTPLSPATLRAEWPTPSVPPPHLYFPAMVELLQPEVDIAVGALLTKAGGEATVFRATWDLDESACLPAEADPLRRVRLGGHLLQRLVICTVLSLSMCLCTSVFVSVAFTLARAPRRRTSCSPPSRLPLNLPCHCVTACMHVQNTPHLHASFCSQSFHAGRAPLFSCEAVAQRPGTDGIMDAIATGVRQGPSDYSFSSCR